MLNYESLLERVPETVTEKDASSNWCASSDKFVKRPAAGHGCSIFVSVTVQLILCA